jgi:hypothetical protein
MKTRGHPDQENAMAGSLSAGKAIPERVIQQISGLQAKIAKLRQQIKEQTRLRALTEQLYVETMEKLVALRASVKKQERFLTSGDDHDPA